MDGSTKVPAADAVKKHRSDIILIASLLLVSLIATCLLLLTRRDGAYAAVEIDGERVAVYPLSEDGEYSLNGGSNVLIIENGEAYLSYADCPDGICVKTGRVRHAGESIICLPNRVAVIIEGDDGDGVDIVS